MPSTDAQAPARAASTDARLHRAFSLAADPAIKVVSFDVFDTLLFRRVPDPVDAFELLGAALRDRGLLAPHVVPAVFARLRAGAEQRARIARMVADGGQEISLEEVYRLLAIARLLGSDPDIGALVEAEVEVEGTLLVPDLDVAALLDAAREHGKTCVAVSDTYFTERHLVRLLGARVAPLDRIFASSAHGVGKAGGLWPKVVEALAVEPSEILHVGDNEDADVTVPGELGVRCVHFERRDDGLAEILVRERREPEPHIVAEHGDFGLTALRGKVRHRREAGDLPRELRPFWDYGATALGPAFTGFAEWIHERALTFGASKALCFMREGTLLAQMVNDAGAYLEERVTAEPLFLSRQVLARAAIHSGEPEELAALLVRRTPPTVRTLCRTLDLDVARIPSLAARADARLDDAGLRDEVFGTLSSEPELRTHLVAAGSQARERVLRLIERVRPPGEPNLVLVDLGWQATAQAQLHRILFEAGAPVHPVGLYMLTHEGAIDRQFDGVEVHAFLAESGEPRHAVRAIIRSPEILEQVCMPDHGSQVDLTAELEPVLAPAGEEGVLQSAERHAVQQGLFAFQREWTRYRVQVPDALPALTRGAAPLLRAQVTRAVAAPTGEEARIFSAWLHDENFGAAGSEAIAGGDAVRALRHMDPQTLVDLPMTELYWPFGLAALHDEHLARAAELVALGTAGWEAFGSRLETGDVEVFADDGWGFSEKTKLTLRGRRNRFGLTYLQARVGGREVRAVRVDPARAPCLIRLDWITLRCSMKGRGEPVEVTLDTPEALARVGLRELEWIAPKVLRASGNDPQLHLDVPALAGGEAYAVEVHLALAILPTLPPEPGTEAVLAQRVLQTRKVVRRLEIRTGVPITPLFRRAVGLLRRGR